MESSKRNQTIFAIDFFCGSGGLTKGLQNSGIKVLFGIDNDITAKKTYEKNNKIPFINANISNLSHQDLDKLICEHLPSHINTKLLFAGCAPCQPFSKLKRVKNTNGDSELLSSFYNLISYFKPDFVLSENVRQIIKHRVFQDFTSGLMNNSYFIDYGVIDVKDFGVPQTRKRMLLLASKESPIKLPKLTKTKKTVRDTIGHLPKIDAGEEHKSISNHKSMNLSKKNLSRIEYTPHNGGDSRDWPDFIKNNCQLKLKSKGYYDFYGRMKWDDVSPTLTTKCVSYSNGRFGHPEQNRAISLKEAALLQSFPSDYIFFGSVPQIAKHIGNAVPPKFAEYIGSIFQ